jgi:hypothetical protein
MAILYKFPMVTQRTNVRPATDPDPNGGWDCVEASVGVCLLWYLGLNQWTEQINPDALKNAAYGDYYTGGTSAGRLVSFCRALGLHLYPIDGTPAQLVQTAHQLIESGRPAIFTEPDPYSSNPNDSHVCVFFADGPGNLTALDPFPVPNGASVQRTDAAWQARLLFNQLWTMEPLGEDIPMLQPTDPMGRFYQVKNDHTWHCIQTGQDLAWGHLDFWRRHGGAFGLNLTSEIRLSQLPQTAIVVYQRAIAIYDPDNVSKQKMPGDGPVFLLRIDSEVGQQIIAKPLIDELNAKIAELEKQITATPDVAALQAQLAGYQQAVAQFVTAVKPLTKKASA